MGVHGGNASHLRSPSNFSFSLKEKQGKALGLSEGREPWSTKDSFRDQTSGGSYSDYTTVSSTLPLLLKRRMEEMRLRVEV